MTIANPPPHVVVGMPVRARTVTISHGDDPKSYMCQSIANMFCCPLFGIIALTYSVKTRRANRYELRDEAIGYSRRAKRFNFIGILIGLCVIAFCTAYFIIINSRTA